VCDVKLSVEPMCIAALLNLKNTCYVMKITANENDTNDILQTFR